MCEELVPILHTREKNARVLTNFSQVGNYQREKLFGKGVYLVY